MSRASQRAGVYDCGEGSHTPETSELSGATSAVVRASEQGRATGLWVQGTSVPNRAKKLSWENGQEIKVNIIRFFVFRYPITIATVVVLIKATIE